MSDGYQDLKVWAKAMELCERTYEATATMPVEERFGLTAQMRRAAISIPSNIAEGHSRQNVGHYRHHLQMARGSVGELETQLILATRLKLLNRERVTEALSLCDELSRMLNALIKSLPDS